VKDEKASDTLPVGSSVCLCNVKKDGNNTKDLIMIKSQTTIVDKSIGNVYGLRRDDLHLFICIPYPINNLALTGSSR
jgi:hypothetical protein